MTFADMYDQFVTALLDQEPFQRNEWQSIDISRSTAHATRELLNVVFQCRVPDEQDKLATMTGADLPWAENHFQERVSGTPHNPPPSHTTWPYAVRGNEDHTTGGKFDHTYPERFWPRHAGLDASMFRPEHRSAVLNVGQHQGIRYRYGDLSDVVSLLTRNPFTRQAYLPVWFPEDTGVVDGQRVPCTLGYHFIMDRNQSLNINYFIRSCDIYRHFRNDVYLAGRLLQWVTQQVNDNRPENRLWYMSPGDLTMFISSLHSFVGDHGRLRNASKP